MEAQESPDAHYPNLLDLAAVDPPTFQSNHEVQTDQGVKTNQGAQWNQDSQSDQRIMQDELNHDNNTGWSAPLAMNTQNSPQIPRFQDSQDGFGMYVSLQNNLGIVEGQDGLDTPRGFGKLDTRGTEVLRLLPI